MAHLIRSISSDDKERRTPAEVRALLKDAHEFIVACARTAIRAVAAVDGAQRWGRDVKRTRVRLPERDRPTLVPPELIEHNLVEVVNQCATVERLIDALAWASSEESGLASCWVRTCHPTTGSDASADAIDHDLVLADERGIAACFEVSDVVGSSDTNAKLARDLRSLGVMTPDSKHAVAAERWPTHRCFVVMSSSHSSCLGSRALADFEFVRREIDDTVIAEIERR
ncbi:MAG: hypothetical protein JNK05_37120 [Myxococcales bacterium]|nr:hypothetical protein [Myxococcales bacterium]